MPPERLHLDHEEAGAWNRRFGVALADGARVEAVLYRGDTLCISTQVGCAVGCPFCASGARGLERPLGFAELVEQVEAVFARGHALRRVTLSGVGEPLHNFEAVVAFLAWARARGLGVSVTTSGGPLGRLRELLHLPHNGLTLSVHAGTEATRARLVPKGPPLDALFALLAEELPRLGRNRRKKTALAYLAVAGENDAPAEVDAFLERARPLGLAVHLYALNPVPGSPFRSVSRERYEALYRQMTAPGLRVRMSSQARVEANGGCGTLVARLRRARDADQG
jgi:23S rRNA (adenine2503-C2)-methyltransferase